MAAGTLVLAAGDFPEDPALADYMAWAQENHPRLVSDRALFEAARQGAVEAGALPDLKLSWGEMIVPVETRVGPQQRIFSVSQSLPWFGTLGAFEAAAESRAKAVQSRWRAERLEVGRRVRQAWFELARLQQELVLTRRHLELSRQSEDVALRAYESGLAPFRNVLQAQMDNDNLRHGVESLRDRLKPSFVALNSAAGLPTATAMPEALLPEISADFLNSTDLKEILHNQNPELEMLGWLEEGHEHSAEAARLSARPGLTLGLDYIMTGSARMPDVVDSGRDPVIARLAVNIPLWSGKAKARRLASSGRLLAASADRARLSLELEQRLENALYLVRDAGRSRLLYENKLLPRARQILEASTTDYEAGRATFDEVINAREHLLKLELDLLGSVTDQALALNDLEALVGDIPDDFYEPSKQSGY